MVALTPLPAPASTGRRRRAAWTLLRWLLGLASGALLFVLLAWLALHWLILPHIENWRPLIERESSKTIGVEVRIGSIEVRSSGWVPTLELRDVQLLDAHGRPTLELARVVASVSARSMAASLANLELRLTQLVIDGARIDARRDAAGRVFVAGLDMSGRSADGETTGAADWILHQGEIGLRGATLRWTDELRAAPALELTHVDLVVRNTLSRHALRLDATPPPEWGERFSLRGVFRQPLLERSGAWRRWSGQLYADAPRADVARLRSYLSLPFELTRGAGAMRAWLELREGEATALTLDVAVQSAELRLAAELEPLVVEQAHGRVVAERRPAGGASVALRGFGFVTGDRLRWPAGDLTLAWTRTRDGGVAAGEFAADRLDLAVVADTAGRLPLGAPVRKLLAETRPQGTASAVRASWSGPLEAPASYNVAARLDGVSIAARPADEADTVGRPGLSHVDLDLTATEKGGQARVAMKNGSLDLPGVFADPVIALDAMRAELSWRIEPVPGGARAVQVQVRGAQLANADAQGTLDATWSTGSGAARLPGRLELDGALSRGTATSAARYLPLGLPEGVRQYVQQAVQGGEIKRATFRVAGDLRDFPHFAAAEGGEFRVAIELEDVTLAYVPGGPEVSPWPPMTQGSGELVFNRNAFEFRAAHANVLGVALSHLHGGIRDLTDNPLLTLDTQAQGPLADMLRFVIATPGGDGVRTALRDATASGDAKLQLALRLPLHEPDRTSVAGSLTLSGNDLRRRADRLRTERILLEDQVAADLMRVVAVDRVGARPPFALGLGRPLVRDSVVAHAEVAAQRGVELEPRPQRPAPRRGVVEQSQLRRVVPDRADLGRAVRAMDAPDRGVADGHEQHPVVGCDDRQAGRAGMRERVGRDERDLGAADVIPPRVTGNGLRFVDRDPEARPDALAGDEVEVRDVEIEVRAPDQCAEVSALVGHHGDELGAGDEDREQPAQNRAQQVDVRDHRALEDRPRGARRDLQIGRQRRCLQHRDRRIRLRIEAADRAGVADPRAQPLRRQRLRIQADRPRGVEAEATRKALGRARRHREVDRRPRSVDDVAQSVDVDVGQLDDDHRPRVDLVDVDRRIADRQFQRHTAADDALEQRALDEAQPAYPLAPDVGADLEPERRELFDAGSQRDVRVHAAAAQQFTDVERALVHLRAEHDAHRLRLLAHRQREPGVAALVERLHVEQRAALAEGVGDDARQVCRRLADRGADLERDAACVAFGGGHVGSLVVRRWTTENRNATLCAQLAF